MQGSNSSTCSKTEMMNECSNRLSLRLRACQSRLSRHSKPNARTVSKSETCSQKSPPTRAPTAKNRRAERRKSVPTVRPAFPFKSRRLTSRHSTVKRGEDVGEFEPSTSMIVSDEERRAMHREHERQRHQSLNDAMQELVNILPPTETPKSVTKYNVLQKANEYMDFLQHKIARLCLELGIEHKVQDGRMSFSVPLNTILGKEELQIPASTAISPKLLQGFHKAAMDHPPVKRATHQADKQMSITTTCRYQAKNKSSQEKSKICKVESTNVIGLDKKAQYAPTMPTLSSGSVHIKNHPTVTLSDTVPSASQFSRGLDTPKSGHDFYTGSQDTKSLQLSSPDTEFNKSPQHRNTKSSWLQKIGSPYTSSPPSFNREQRKKLLDHYISSADSSSDQGENVSTLEKAVATSADPELCCPRSISELKTSFDPESMSFDPDSASFNPESTPFDPESTSFDPESPSSQVSNSTYDHLHSEHSYSARYLPTCIPSAAYSTKAVTPSDTVSLRESPQISYSESKMTTQVISANQGLVNRPTAPVTSTVFLPPVYVHQQPISFPIKVTAAESMPVPVAFSAPASSHHVAQNTTVTTSVNKSTPRYVPIQPANNVSIHDVVSVLPTAVTFRGTSTGNSAVKKKTPPLATLASARELVVDPNRLHFEDSDSPLEAAYSSNPSSVVTSTASSTCSMRRSWINGYQLFTKVNHPRFRDKWPRLQGREITRLLSQSWKELSSDYKKHYSRRARDWNQWHRSQRESANVKQAVTEE